MPEGKSRWAAFHRIFPLFVFLSNTLFLVTLPLASLYAAPTDPPSVSVPSTVVSASPAEERGLRLVGQVRPFLKWRLADC